MIDQERAFQLLAMVAGTYVGPIVTDLLKLWADGRFRRLSVPINGVLCIGLYLGGWKLFSGAESDFPIYLAAGATAALAGSSFVAARERMEESRKLRELPAPEAAAEVRIAEAVDSGEVVGELVERATPSAPDEFARWTDAALETELARVYEEILPLERKQETEGLTMELVERLADLAEKAARIERSLRSRSPVVPEPAP